MGTGEKNASPGVAQAPRRDTPAKEGEKGTRPRRARQSWYRGWARPRVIREQHDVYVGRLVGRPAECELFLKPAILSATKAYPSL